jgi:glyoxylase-like metal-dependent hydrolase (beta-lactamase superfamily II)
MPLYSIWVAEFASIPQFPDALMLAGHLAPTARRLPYTYVVIQGQGRTILVDVGFDFRDYAKALVTTMGLNDWQPPAEILGQLAIDPADVTDIIITHAHFDHMGGMDFFPNARFTIQKRELTEWVWALSVDPKMQKLHFTVNPADILKAVNLGIAGRLTCLEGDVEDLFPGIDVRLARDTHTWGSMFVCVRNDGLAAGEDRYVLAGDLVYAYENLGVGGDADGVYTPIAAGVGGPFALLTATQALIDAAGGDPLRVIPAHEDRLGDRFASVRRPDGLRLVEIALATGTDSKIA